MQDYGAYKFPVVPRSCWEPGLRNQPSSSAGTWGRVWKWWTWPWGFLCNLSTLLKAECDPHTFFISLFIHLVLCLTVRCTHWGHSRLLLSVQHNSQYISPFSAFTRLSTHFKRQSLLIPFFILSGGLYIPVHFHTVSLLSSTALLQRQSLEGTMQTVLQKLTSVRWTSSWFLYTKTVAKACFLPEPFVAEL